MYTVTYFINKFEAIPEDMFITGLWYSGNKKCANGHCGISDSRDKSHEARGLKNLFNLLEADLLGNDVSNTAMYINDGKDKRYKQATPKQRILAALYDIKKIQEAQEGNKPEYNDITKDLAILPVEETADQPIKITVQ